MYRKVLLMSLSLLQGFGLARAQETERTTSVITEWELGLDSGGNVVSLALKPGRAKEALREILDKAIRSWKFKPAEIDGRPAATDTHLVVTLSFAP